MKGYKLVPNALTVSRLPIGLGIAILALSGEWPWAFALLAAGLLTDWLDGYLAVQLDAKSDFGGKILEPAGDMSLTLGALGGLIFTKTLSWLIIFPLGAVLLVIWAPIFLGKTDSRFRNICNGLAPLYYLAVIISITAAYAFEVFGTNALWLLIFAVPATWIAVKVKRRRIASWLANFGKRQPVA